MSLAVRVLTMSALTVESVKAVPHLLATNRDLAFRIDRSGYVAFIHATGHNEFELVHRHYHEDEWRHDQIAKTRVYGTVARFSHCGDVVSMPELNEVTIPHP